MITERALVFQKIRLRYCRNLVLYAIPESPDIIESICEFMNPEYWSKIQEHRLRQVKQRFNARESTWTKEDLLSETQKILAEGKT